jgi:hypothetical protein
MATAFQRILGKLSKALQPANERLCTQMSAFDRMAGVIAGGEGVSAIGNYLPAENPWMRLCAAFLILRWVGVEFDTARYQLAGLSFDRRRPVRDFSRGERYPDGSTFASAPPSLTCQAGTPDVHERDWRCALVYSAVWQLS